MVSTVPVAAAETVAAEVVFAEAELLVVLLRPQTPPYIKSEYFLQSKLSQL